MKQNFVNIFFHEKSHPLTSWASQKKPACCHMKVSFRAIWETWATPSNISCFLNGKVRLWSVYGFFTNIFGSKIRALFFLLIIFIQVEKEIRLRLTDIPWAVELSGKTAMISTKPRIRRIVRITSHDISYNRGKTNGFHESYALFFAKV